LVIDTSKPKYYQVLRDKNYSGCSIVEEHELYKKRKKEKAMKNGNNEK
jgi:hypothetical protein